MIKKLEYYISTDNNPYKNLATEKYLLDNVPNDTCLLYLWQNENTVVIGRNQNPWTECDCNALTQNGGRVARRLSGGGAVYHDLGNLNFTFISSAENMDLGTNLKIIKSACAMAGIDAEISGRNDILADGKKFSGNAFYNSKGKSYHHGTILIDASREKMSAYLTPSKAKLQSKGVKSVKSRVVNLMELSPSITCETMKEYMLSAFESEFGLSASKITAISENDIENDVQKFSSWEFIFGSTFPFSASYEKRFEWGSASLLLQISDGLICSAKLYTDSMDHNLSEAVETSLAGCRFEENEIKKALGSKLSPTLSKDFLDLINGI